MTVPSPYLALGLSVAVALALVRASRELARRRAALVWSFAALASTLERRRATLAALLPLARQELVAAGAPQDRVARAQRASSSAAGALARRLTDPAARAELARAEEELEASLEPLRVETGARLAGLFAEVQQLHTRRRVLARSFDAAAQAYNARRARPPLGWIAGLLAQPVAHLRGL